MSRRSELKENILASKLEVVVEWIIANRPKVLTGLVIIVGAGLISSVFMIRQAELKESNWTRLAQARAFLNQNMHPQAEQILQEIKKSSAGGTLRLYASLYLGELQIVQKKWDESIASFNDVIEKSGSSPLKPLAISSLGFAYEEKKDFDSAVQTYRTFLEKFSDHFLAPRVQLSLGRALFGQGNPADAKKELDKLIDLYPTSEWATKARSLIDKNQTR